jgi:signal recognition particle subunit SRP19
LRRDNTHYFVYPEYLDKTLKRSEGRRLPLDSALENPTLDEIRLAAEKLNLDYDVIKEGSYPRQWWNSRGLILIEKKDSKLNTLRNLSYEIDKNIRPALEKMKRELKEGKKKKLRKREDGRKRVLDSKKIPSKPEKEFRPKRRR